MKFPNKTMLTTGLFVCILMAAMIYFTASTANDQLDPTNPLELPNTLSNYTLERAVTGAPAKLQIERLHGTNIDMKEAYIYTYNSANIQLTIWISQHYSDQEAHSMIDIMNEKMPESRAFQNYKTLSIDGYQIEYVTGMDMDHYYYAQGAYAIWLSAPDDAEKDFPVLREFISSFTGR